MGGPHGPKSNASCAIGGRRLLLIGEVLREHHLPVLGIGRLIAEIDALADDRIGIDVDRLRAIDLLHEFVWRQFFHRRLTLRRIGRLWNKPGRGEQVLLVLYDLLRRLASGQQKRRRENSRCASDLHHDFPQTI